MVKQCQSTKIIGGSVPTRQSQNNFTVESGDMALSDMHNNKKVIQLETHSPSFISQSPCPCHYPCPYPCLTYCPLLRTLH